MNPMAVMKTNPNDAARFSDPSMMTLEEVKAEVDQIALMAELSSTSYATFVDNKGVQMAFEEDGLFGLYDFDERFDHSLWLEKISRFDGLSKIDFVKVVSLIGQFNSMWAGDGLEFNVDGVKETDLRLMVLIQDLKETQKRDFRCEVITMKFCDQFFLVGMAHLDLGRLDLVQVIHPTEITAVRTRHRALKGVRT